MTIDTLYVMTNIKLYILQEISTFQQETLSLSTEQRIQCFLLSLRNVNVGHDANRPSLVLPQGVKEFGGGSWSCDYLMR
jgi:hypothetical protein